MLEFSSIFQGEFFLIDLVTFEMNNEEMNTKHKRLRFTITLIIYLPLLQSRVVNPPIP